MGPSYQYKAKLIKVVDADTIDVEVDLGFYTFQRIRLRYFGIDAWETRGPERPEGLKAKDALSALFDEGSELVVETFKTGKYGRWLAKVFVLMPDGSWLNTNDWLVAEGHAELAEY